LPLITQEAFTELMEQLESEQTKIWPELCQRMKFREVQAFSDRLNQWAEQYPLADLLYYVNLVANQKHLIGNNYPIRSPNLRQLLPP
jgi:formate dehydrogenase maturation protein FdhE